MTIEERNKLFEDNMGIIHMTLHNNGFDVDDDVYDDLFQECSIFILDKLPNWTPERGAITTFIGMLTDYAIRMWRRNNCSLIQTISEDAPLYVGDDGDTVRLCDSMLYAGDTDIIKDCCAKCDLEDLFKRFETLTLSDGRRNRSLKHLHLVKERYLEGKSVITLAKKYGESRMSISKKIFQCLTILRKLIKEKGE